MANTDSDDTNVIWSFLMAAYASIRFAIVAMWAFTSSRFFSTPVNQAINSQAITNHGEESLIITESCASGEISPKTSSASVSSFSKEQSDELKIRPDSNESLFEGVSENSVPVKPTSPEGHTESFVFVKANVKSHQLLPEDIQHNVNAYLSING